MPALMSVEQMEGYSRQRIIEELDDKVLLEAQDRFDYYQRNGVITKGDFQDDCWQMYDQIRYVYVRFELSELFYRRNLSGWIGCEFQEYLLCIKAYTLLCMGRYALPSIVQIVKCLCQIIGTDIDESSFRGEDVHIVTFLEMLPGETIARDEVIERIRDKHSEHRMKRGARKMPSFRAYFRFHDVVTDFWKVAPDEKKEFYFPICFWWQLTAILPLRATEFLLTPRACLEQEKDRHYLMVRRTKLKKNRHKIAYRINEDYELVKYCIPLKMAESISWYIERTKQMKQTSISTLLIPPQSSNRGYFTYDQMECLLRRFCREFMDDENYPVHLGDTRHLAMINLIISGGSPVICRELAGHESIDISSHYYSNMSSLVEDIVYERYRRNMTDASMSGNNRFYLSVPNHSARIENGYCDIYDVHEGNVTECLKSIDSEGIPGDCYNCIHFYPDKKGLKVSVKDSRKKAVDMDAEFLIDMIELVRRGYGCEEDIKSALKRIQRSVNRYSIACRWEDD